VAVPVQRFSHIHVELVGPLPTSEGATYVFTVIDRNTWWFESLPLNDISAKSCASVLIQGWIARYGVLAVITLDRGSQFMSALWDSLCNILGIKQVQTTAYHPQANGLVERFHRRLKDALRAHLAGPTWTAHLPWVLLGLRAAPREEDKISPTQAVFGTPIVLPGQFLDANANVNEPEFFIKFSSELGAAESVATRHNSARAQDVPDELPADLLRAPAFLVRRDGHVPPLEPLYDGPYRMLACSRDWFRIQVGDRTDTTPSLPAASSPAWTSPRRQLSLATEDDPLGRPKRSHSTGRPRSHRRHAWLYRRRLQHHHRFPLRWPLQGRQHHLGLGLEPYFLPSARGFLYAWAPTRRSGPPHRPGGRNATGGRRSG
jgi:transposase InsO family protein